MEVCHLTIWVTSNSGVLTSNHMIINRGLKGNVGISVPPSNRMCHFVVTTATSADFKLSFGTLSTLLERCSKYQNVRKHIVYNVKKYHKDWVSFADIRWFSSPLLFLTQQVNFYVCVLVFGHLKVKIMPRSQILKVIFPWNMFQTTL